jgi:threonine dehydratase
VIERKLRAEQIAREDGLAMVPPFDHRHIIAGQGTVGLEIARDWRDVDVVLVPIGGGGLAAGVCAAVKRTVPEAKVIGVEPVGAASMRAALDHEGPTLIPEVDTIADGLMPVIVGQLTYEHARDLMDDLVLVTDDAIRQAVTLLVTRHKIVVEFSGAATTAALLSGVVSVQGARVAAVVSGGNIDPALLGQLGQQA